jgi:hypothetical protein
LVEELVWGERDGRRRVGFEFGILVVLGFVWRWFGKFGDDAFEDDVFNEFGLFLEVLAIG